MLLLSGCFHKNRTETEITGYKEYMIIVASTKLPGVVTSCGNTVSTDVFAVKTENSAEWEPLPYIIDFEYEPGYEYEIRISRTNYLDYDRAEPAWTEYKFLEQVSKVSKESEDLPENFIPEWFYEKNRYNIKLAYFIDAENNEAIEGDLTTNPLIPSGSYLFNEDMTKWQLVDKDNIIRSQGTLQRKNKDFTEFPDSYKQLDLAGKVARYGEWNFIYEFSGDKAEVKYDVFLFYPNLRSSGNRQYQAALYKDLTDYYTQKYPDAGVRTVVYSLTLTYNAKSYD